MSERQSPTACGLARARNTIRPFASWWAMPTLLLILAVASVGCSKSTPAPSPAASSSPANQTLTVFAAASTVDVMNEAARLFKASTGVEVKCSFDASSNLARQIIAGAPADVFISADEKWMDEVEKEGDIEKSTRVDLLGNTLVLIGPKGSPLAEPLTAKFDLPAALQAAPKDARIALADPAHVPAGRYAKQALEHLQWWAAVEPRVIPAQDVRAALRLVERGEADAGIVYATDAKASKDVIVLGELPADSHEQVRYPIAITRNAGSATSVHNHVVQFVAFLQSDAMKKVFTDAGFRVLTDEQ